MYSRPMERREGKKGKLHDQLCSFQNLALNQNEEQTVLFTVDFIDKLIQ